MVVGRGEPPIRGVVGDLAPCVVVDILGADILVGSGCLAAVRRGLNSKGLPDEVGDDVLRSASSIIVRARDDAILVVDGDLVTRVVVYVLSADVLVRSGGLAPVGRRSGV